MGGEIQVSYSDRQKRKDGHVSHVGYRFIRSATNVTEMTAERCDRLESLCFPLPRPWPYTLAVM